MFCMITSWNVRFGAQKPHIDAFFSWLFLADSIKRYKLGTMGELVMVKTKSLF